MKNEYLNNSADSKAEDLIRAMVQFGCAEMHAKSLYEQAVAEMDNGLIDVDDGEVVMAQIDKCNFLLEQVNAYAELRRKSAFALYDMYNQEEEKGNKKLWCLVKHTGVGSMQAWETYQASEDDPQLLQLALEANKAFVKALTAFIGAEITDCAACLGDFLKATS